MKKFYNDIEVYGNLSIQDVTAQSITTTGLSAQFTDENEAVNYIGKNVGTTKNPLTISTGTHIFTNCTGTINYTNNSSAKVYVVNSPSLTINGKSASNWMNIFTDGVANSPDGVITIWQDGRMMQRFNKTMNFAVVNPSGTLFGSTGQQVGMFPLAFSDIPLVTIQNSSPWGMIIVLLMSTTQTQIGKISINTTYSITDNYDLRIDAIGRWK